MKANSSSIAKITRPKLSDIAIRERLMPLLDKGSGKPVIWVGAPAGSGKTTLIASYLDLRKLPCLWYQVDVTDGDIASFFYYLGQAAGKAAPRYKKPLPLLTPEYLQGIPVFTRRYFEELFRRLKPSTLVVFDNYQNAPQGSGFHEMFVHALETVPETVTVVVLSRNEPPSQFSRLLASNKLHFLGWDDLRFTLPESQKLLKTQGRKGISPDALKTLHAKTEGWAAGLILLMARTSIVQGAYDFDNATAGRVFDYFANEIFDTSNSLTQYFLLATAYLPSVTAAMAEQLTGIKEAGTILEELNSRHYFTQKHAMGEQSYQYHALFREFLLSRAKGYFDAGEQLSIKRKAAGLLQTSGQIEDAAALLIDAKDWNALVRLILRGAKAFVTQGRSKTLEGWILAIPEIIRNKNAWLLYWLGACRIPFNPAEGRMYFEKAFRLFEVDGDRTGMLLSWSEVVDAFMVGWDELAPLDYWIDWFHHQDAGQDFPTATIEARCASSITVAMAWRQPFHADIAAWVGRALDTARKSQNPELLLRACVNAMYYYLWTGDIANNLLITEEIKTMSRNKEVSPLVWITSKWLEATAMYWASADHEAGVRALREALTMAVDHGIHVWDHMIYALGVYGAILKGDRGLATEFLEKMKSTLRPDRGQGYCHYHYVAGWYNAVMGEPTDALLHTERSVTLAKEISGTSVYFPEILCRVGLANILCGQKEYEEAERQLAAARDLTIRTRSDILEFMRLAVLAGVAFGRGKDEEGVAVLRNAMAMGRSHNFISMLWWWQPSFMSELCRKALEADIEAEYVRKIIRAHNLVPAEAAIHVEQWPWPIRIYTLGTFRIEKNDKELIFSGKVQKKPLDLLKAIIAFGGEDVPEEQITDALWPEAEGDAAHKAFEMALVRLRRLIGDDRAIRLSEGKLTIDPRVCWVDVKAAEQEMAAAEAAWSSGRLAAEKAAASTEKAISRYARSFLSDNRHDAWIATAREHLNGRVLRLLARVATYHEERNDWEQALAFLEKGLALDDLAEEIYHRLMLCNLHLGRKAEAARLYDRCKRRLSAALGITPSVKTEEIYRLIRQSR